jgi:hypothetical protein
MSSYPRNDGFRLNLFCSIPPPIPGLARDPALVGIGHETGPGFKKYLSSLTAKAKRFVLFDFLPLAG